MQRNVMRRRSLGTIVPQAIKFPEDEALAVYRSRKAKKSTSYPKRKEYRNEQEIPLKKTLTACNGASMSEQHHRQESCLSDKVTFLKSFDRNEGDYSVTSSTDLESDFSNDYQESNETLQKGKPSNVKNSRELKTRRASLNLYAGEGFEVAHEDIFHTYATPQYDPWDERIDRQGQPYTFDILGTSQHDFNALPHVLSPPIMHTLQSSLPFCKRSESFWLKYSMVRDGASMSTFLDTLRESQYTLMAIETVDGEVFGAFTTSAWMVQPSFFGGGESFLWRMKQSRAEVSDSVSERARRETDLDIFPYCFENPFIQLCQQGKISIGGGIPCSPRRVSSNRDDTIFVMVEPKDFGCAIAFEGDCMLEATTAPCVTFNCPSLSKLHEDGSRFGLLNLEVWSFSACSTLGEAKLLESQYHFSRSQAAPPTVCR